MAEIIRRPRHREWVRALTDVSFQVGPGEFFGLLGANGAGKTTLMKVLATLILPDQGQVEVGGFDVQRHAAQVREVLTLSLATERGLFWRLSARENLRVFADLYRVPAAAVEPQVEEALATVGLEGSSERMVREFSSGMMQRLLIARALLGQPQVLLLDEPTRSLDPVSAREFRRFLREELAQRRQCSVLLATHDADEAFRLCDRVAVLDRGQVVAQGTARELAFDSLGTRHVLVTREPQHEAIARAEADGWVSILDRLPAAPGWTRVVMRLQRAPAEMDAEAAGARLVQRLVEAGVPVGEFAVEAVSLADLIETVVARGRAAAGHAS